MTLFPPPFWSWLHGSRERYLWIISGPYPYDRLGSDPLQLWSGILAAGTGVALFSVGALLRKRLNSRPVRPSSR